MEELKQLSHLYNLKQVHRQTSAGNRKESVADHVYSSLILALYFLNKIKHKLNYETVTKILLFHDLVESEMGDKFILDIKNEKNHLESENKAYKKIFSQLPNNLSKEYKLAWEEFYNQKTIESKFCLAIEKLDPMISDLYNKNIWSEYNFTEEKLRNKKEKYFKEFPEILELFNNIIKYFNENNYFKNK